MITYMDNAKKFQKPLSPMEWEKFICEGSMEEWIAELEKLSAHDIGHPEALSILLAEQANPSGPVALAYHPWWGYAVLMSGQGPYICWAEEPEGVKQ